MSLPGLRYSRLVAAGVLLASLSAVAGAQDAFVLIVHPTNAVSVLPRAAVSKMFLRKATSWPDGRRILPVDQVESSPVRRRFSDAVHRMDVPSVKSFWQELVFSGKGDPPPERVTDADVVAYVKSNPSALGYVAATAPLGGVKVLSVTP